MVLRKSKTILGRFSRRSDRGFSLLEVLLALALSVIVIGLITAAMRFHMLTVSRQQKNIESKQVARSVVMIVTNDLRSAILYRPQDFSGLENLAVSQDLISGIAGATGEEEADPSGASGASGTGSAGGEGGGEGGTGGEGAEPPAEEEGADQEEPEVNIARPTLVGDAVSVTMDTSRLPRVDEYNPLIVTQEQIQLPSDVKSVSYFVSKDPPATDDGFTHMAGGSQGGLYRRRIDRAVASFRGELGIIRNVDEYAELIAPEIASISFRYFDGEEYYDAWNSEVDGGFPVAIEVTLILDPSRSDPTSQNEDFGGFDSENMQKIITVVHLPTAEPTAE